jgi:hypothetical protein
MVTANLGGAFAAGEVREAAGKWARSALAERRPAIVFAQEVPSDHWLDIWRSSGYRLWLGEPRGWAVRSVLLTRSDLHISDAGPSDHPTLHYHGSYVAAARWATHRGDVLLASVHASPNRAEPERYGWAGDLPAARDGGHDARYPGKQLWDSDLVAETLRRMQLVSPLLAAGDLNEARGFDVDEAGKPLGTWGREYFDRLVTSGLHPWLHDSWTGERATHAHLQLDHIIVSTEARALLARSPAPHLDRAWLDPAGSGVARSDHAPIWAALSPGWQKA